MLSYALIFLNDFHVLVLYHELAIEKNTILYNVLSSNPILILDMLFPLKNLLHKIVDSALANHFKTIVSI